MTRPIGVAEDAPTLQVGGIHSRALLKRAAPHAPRLLAGVATALLATLFFLPLWSIRLTAPQYPEGLGMEIWLSAIRGATPTDLQNINNLNHYIGMRAIVSESFAELEMMPWILAGVIVLGAVAALSGRRRPVILWTASLLTVALAGVVDMWRWGRVYGHDLDPTAVIKVPGMSYQPPLIGSKQLLNFTANSWPAVGGWIAAFAVLLAVGAVAASVYLRRRRSAFERSSTVMLRVPLAAAVTAFLILPGTLLSQSVLRVGASERFTTITAAVRAAHAGDRILVTAGLYREPTILIEKRVSLIGQGWPVLDGEVEREIMRVSANGVSVQGLRFVNVGRSNVRDYAAIRVVNARDCVIHGNRFENAFFGVYLAGVVGCRITGNILRGGVWSQATESRPASHAAHAGSAALGNGIHLWSSRAIRIAGNQVTGHRDGIYFEFVRDSDIVANRSFGNQRYGLHFMYSDSCRYRRNVFSRNGAGVAVMYTRSVSMTQNVFKDNVGAAAYGLLLKEIYDSELQSNRFTGNSVALYADGATRLRADKNSFERNGWAIRLMASTDGSVFTRNSFLGNTFDVATNSQSSAAVFQRNYWDTYRGYDLDRDGYGDVPHRPVRLFAAFATDNEAAELLLRSVVVRLLDAAERVLPSFTPVGIADTSPIMRQPR